jgi:hypothetical protein
MYSALRLDERPSLWSLSSLLCWERELLRSRLRFSDLRLRLRLGLRENVVLENLLELELDEEDECRPLI